MDFNGILLNDSIIVVLTLSIIPLMLSGGWIYTLKTHHRHKIKEFSSHHNLVMLSITLSALVHELQKERGATGVFMGSRGKKFKVELPNQRKLTDLKEKALMDHLTENTYNYFGDEFVTILQTCIHQISLLADHRKQVNQLVIPNQAGIQYYTKSNALILKTIHHIARLATNPQSTTLVNAYVHFLEGKERAGIERALMSRVFAEDHFGTNDYNLFISLITDQMTFFNVAKSFCFPEQLEFIEKTMDSEIIEQVEKLREQAKENAAKRSLGNVDAADWFSLMTHKINLMKQIEDYLSHAILELSESLYHITMKKVRILTTGFYFMLIGTASAIFYALREWNP